MKKQSLTLALVALAFSFAQAQMTLRPYVGINSHNLSEDFEDSEWKSKVGYQLGADLQIGSKFYVQPGLQLEFTKNELQSTIPGAETLDFTRTNVRIPVMVGYAFGQVDGNFAARIFTGANASFVASAKAEDEDIKEDLNSAVFGWNFGGGLDFSILFIDLGYQIGLSEVFGEELGNKSKDNFFYANAGIRVRF